VREERPRARGVRARIKVKLVTECSKTTRSRHSLEHSPAKRLPVEDGFNLFKRPPLGLMKILLLLYYIFILYYVIILLYYIIILYYPRPFRRIQPTEGEHDTAMFHRPCLWTFLWMRSKHTLVCLVIQA
jgi:hypothetical protein